MATSRQRFMQTLEFQPVDPRWVQGGWVWPETMALWRTQGWDGRNWVDIFDLDTLVNVAPYYGPLPEFDHEVVAEDEQTITYVNYEGILMREMKGHRDMSMPQFLKFPAENEADFEKLAAERLALNRALRFSPEALAELAGGTGIGGRVAKDLLPDAPPVSQEKLLEGPRWCFADRWGGFFGPLRNLMGVQKLCVAFYDQPALVERMMENRAEMIIAITAETLKHTAIDAFWFWEDMAYKAGPLVGPDLFRQFAFKHYRRVIDWLHGQGIKHVGLDSDGDIRQLIPLWLEVGIDHLWPFEVQAGMDVVEVRATYGHDLAMIGGIDKRAVAVGGAVMRREVERVMPVVEDGGYIPELDHGAPPDISWANFCEYFEYLKLRLGRG